MDGKELSDDELEDELEKAFKENEHKNNHCSAALPNSKEVGLKRSNVKLKRD